LKKIKKSKAFELYKKGMTLYYELEAGDLALEYFMKSANAGFEPACGEIGMIYYLDKNDPETAESWFERVSDLELLSPWASYAYAALLLNEHDDWEKALDHLLWAAECNYAPAYQAIGLILYKELNEVDDAEDWFEMAEEAGCLCGIPAYYYGILLEFERGIDGQADYYRAKAIEDLRETNLQETLN